MLMQRLAVGTALGLVVLTATACGKKKTSEDEEAIRADAGGDDTDEDEDEDEKDPRGGRNLDAGSKLDGSTRGSKADGGVGDGEEEGDGGSDDAADAAPPAPKCDVTHKDLGCGKLTPGAGTTGGAGSDGGVAGDGGASAGNGTAGGWLSFDSDVGVDRKTGLAWTKVELAPGEFDAQLRKKCAALEKGGLDNWKIPEMVEVRTLAAGCAATAADGACTVKQEGVPASEAADPATVAKDCTCDDAKAGPHTGGGYCRPEVPDCSTRWTDTHFGDEHGPQHKHWFYDVKTGSIVLAGYETEMAKTAVGYCVTEKPLNPIP